MEQPIKINPKHLVHILAVPAGLFAHRQSGICNYTLSAADIIIARRHELEQTEQYRQLLPSIVFTHDGKIWAYRRTKAGGEPGLHDQVAVSVGGHFDLSDVVLVDGIIDVDASLKAALAREMAEEVKLLSNRVTQHTLPYVIVADDTPVDRKHVALVTIVELDGESVFSNEEELDSLGFISPHELLSSGYKLETWAKMICNMITEKRT